MGMGQTLQVSDINYQLHASTSDNFIRLETLSQANDLISNAIAKLSIVGSVFDLLKSNLEMVDNN